MSRWNVPWRVLLFWAVLFLLPFGSLMELPLLICALFGIRDVWRHPSSIQNPTGRIVLIVFLAYWLPELFSAFDSSAPEKSWQEVILDLRFLPLAWFALLALPDGMSRHQWARLTAVLVMVWTIDALAQAALGISLGGTAQSDRISGIFSDDNLKLGPVLAVLSPILLWSVWQQDRRWLLLAVWSVLGLAILLAGARAAWLSYAIVTLVLLWKLAFSPRRFFLLTALVLGISSVGATASYFASDRFKARVDRSLQALNGTHDSWNTALAGRLPIWSTALKMGVDHPVNGVGVRAFRYAYPAYAEADDLWVRDTGRGALHAHQIVLEIWTETGLIGLLCWIGGAVSLILLWRRTPITQRNTANGVGLSLVVMCFPIGTHFAFYSNFWGVLFWWLLASFMAQLRREQEIRRQ